MRRLEEGSPQLALSDVPEYSPSFCSFILNWLACCKMAATLPGLTSAFQAKTRRKEGGAKPAVLAPFIKKAKEYFP